MRTERFGVVWQSVRVHYSRLPGETVKIENGRVYIDGKLYREDYIIRSNTAMNKLIMVPDRSYFVIGDNRTNPNGNIITREAIVGKVIWHFSSK